MSTGGSSQVLDKTSRSRLHCEMPALSLASWCLTAISSFMLLLSQPLQAQTLVPSAIAPDKRPLLASDPIQRPEVHRTPELPPHAHQSPNADQSPTADQSPNAKQSPQPHQDPARLLVQDPPPPEFLDRKQAALAQTLSAKPEDYIFFADESYAPDQQIVESSHRKAWTEEEKSFISSLVSLLLRRAPGLLQSAAGKSKIAMYRSSSLSAVPELNVVAAHADAGAIVIPDEFLTCNHQFKTLVHELVHVADF